MEYHPSWITKTKWQLVAGTIVAALIIAAGLVPIYVSQSETAARQDADRSQQVRADRAIRIQVHNGKVDLACGLLRGIDVLSPQIPVPSLGSATDQATIDRIVQTNATRRQARLVLRDSMPPDIKADVIKTCPAPQ